MHRGERRRHDLTQLAVAHARDLHVLGYAVPILAQARQRAVRDRVGRAHNSVDLGIAVQQLLGRGVARVNGEVGHDLRARRHLDPRLGAGVEKPQVTVATGRQVLFKNANVGRVLRASKHLGRHVTQRPAVVLKNARVPGQLLVKHHQRQAHRGHGLAVRVREHRCHQNNPVHLPLFIKKPQVGHLARCLVIGVGEKNLMPAARKNRCHPGDHSAHRGRVDLGDDDPHRVGLACPQALGVLRRRVPRGLHHGPDLLALLLAHVPVVEVTRHGGARHARHLRDLVDVQAVLPTFVRPQTSITGRTTG